MQEPIQDNALPDHEVRHVGHEGVEDIVNDALSVGPPTREAIDGQPTAVSIAMRAEVALVQEDHYGEAGRREETVEHLGMRVDVSGSRTRHGVFKHGEDPRRFVGARRSVSCEVEHHVLAVGGEGILGRQRAPDREIGFESISSEHLG